MLDVWVSEQKEGGREKREYRESIEKTRRKTNRALIREEGDQNAGKDSVCKGSLAMNGMGSLCNKEVGAGG